MIEKNFVIRATSTAKNKETVVSFFAKDLDTGLSFFAEGLSSAEPLSKEEAQKELDYIKNEKEDTWANGTITPGRLTCEAAFLHSQRPESHVVFEILEVQLIPSDSFARDVKFTKISK